MNRSVNANADRLHETAAALTGLSDFGDSSYRAGLDALLQSYDDNPNQLPECRARCEGSIIGALRGRLLSEEGWKRHPHVLKQPITAPIIIVGLPRTGTSALHKLLNVDPQIQGLEMWLGSSPAIRPPRSEWEAHPDFRMMADFIANLYASIPPFRTMHDIAADRPDEDWTLLIQDFAVLMFLETAHVPAFQAWVEQRYRADIAYRRFADNLRLIGANDRDKRWVLKDPMHLFSTDAVLDTFPDAFIIQTHRDPMKCIASVCSLSWQLSRHFENPDCDPKLVGRRKIDQWSRALKRTLEVRKAHPQRFLDVDFLDIQRDPIAVVKRVYAFCGLTLEPRVEQSMRAWVEDNQKGKRGEHRYDLETFGIDESDVTDAFADYLADYRIAREKAAVT